MNKTTLFLCFILISLTACTSRKSDESALTVLQGATIFDGNGGVLEQGVIIVRDGLIEAVGGSEVPIPENAEILDLKGKYISPGLVDSHVHFGQTGFFDGRPDALDIRDTLGYVELQSYLQQHPERYYEAYLRSGVTAVYDVGGYLWTLGLQKTAEDNLNAPHVAAAGPLLSPVPDANLVAVNTPGQKQLLHLSSADFGRQTVRQNTSLGATGIKIWQINLEDPQFMEALAAVVDEVALQGNKLIVHATDLDQATEALRMGAQILVHSVDDQVVDSTFLDLAKKSGVIYCPTLIVGRGYLNAYKSLKEGFGISDPNGVVDPQTRNLLLSATKFFKYLPNPDGYETMISNYKSYVAASEKNMFENLRRVHQAGIPIAVSTDAGNPGTLHGISIYDEMETMQQNGIPARDILIMATRNGALAMDRLDDFGTLEKGKMADLIILENDPTEDIANMRSVTHVMRAGLLRPVNVPFDKTGKQE
ncbi:amidohydrolase family protein [Robiginitalea sp. IMCC43444]|uniref:amidohydrolase family protein n=1 Tax=Robiginitalea sp. IMCC43444 TaxID=3459121 RepID=UPI004042C782